MPPSPPARSDPRGRGARERIVGAALVRFRRDGINATGVSELAAAAQVSKRTLYQHFPSKDEVVVAYLQALEAQPELGPEAALSNAELAPRARMLELFTALSGQERPFRGCPFVAAALERPDPASRVHRCVAAHKERFAEQLTELARAAGARPAETVARRLAVLYDGAAAQSMAFDSSEPTAVAFTLAADVLNAATAD